jgi:hypothetical protein
MLPFFRRAYEPFVDRVFVYDDGSTDRSLEILGQWPRATIVPITTRGDAYVASLLTLYDDCWKRSRGEADWVIVGNVDEIFHHPTGLDAYLAACGEAGVTLVVPDGFEMIADRFPEADEDLVQSFDRGVRMPDFDKPAVFSPDAIQEIRFAPGRHAADPVGRVVMPKRRELRMLHYKFLGLDYTRSRYRELASRRRPGDLAHQWGEQYALDDNTLAQRFDAYAKGAVNVFRRRGRFPDLWRRAASVVHWATTCAGVAR